MSSPIRTPLHRTSTCLTDRSPVPANQPPDTAPSASRTAHAGHSEQHATAHHAAKPLGVHTLVRAHSGGSRVGKAAWRNCFRSKTVSPSLTEMPGCESSRGLLRPGGDAPLPRARRLSRLVGLQACVWRVLVCWCVLELAGWTRLVGNHHLSGLRKGGRSHTHLFGPVSSATASAVSYFNCTRIRPPPS